MPNFLDPFDRIRVINLVDRPDRRREMIGQLRRLGMSDDARVEFYTATRPADAAQFPSLGARGCFESHLAIVREALLLGVERLLIMEDDLDFAPDIERRGVAVASALSTRTWGMFYGTPILEPQHARALQFNEPGLADLPTEFGVQTTSCVGFARPALMLLEPFLTAMLGRSAGSLDYGPMHVDGAYSVFRHIYPSVRTLACQPPIGKQRASRSDIAEKHSFLDRFVATRPLANRLRRARERLQR